MRSLRQVEDLKTFGRFVAQHCATLLIFFVLGYVGGIPWGVGAADAWRGSVFFTTVLAVMHRLTVGRWYAPLHFWELPEWRRFDASDRERIERDFRGKVPDEVVDRMIRRFEKRVERADESR